MTGIFFLEQLNNHQFISQGSVQASYFRLYTLFIERFFFLLRMQHVRRSCALLFATMVDEGLNINGSLRHWGSYLTTVVHSVIHHITNYVTVGKQKICLFQTLHIHNLNWYHQSILLAKHYEYNYLLSYARMKINISRTLTLR